MVLPYVTYVVLMFGRKSSIGWWNGAVGGWGQIAPHPPPINRPRKGCGSVQQPPLSGHRSSPPSTPHNPPTQKLVWVFASTYIHLTYFLCLRSFYFISFCPTRQEMSSLFLDLSMSTKKKKVLREVLPTYLCTL